MGTINMEIPDEIDNQFRKAVFETKGMKRGNLVEAVTEALQLWIEKNKKKEEKA